MSEEDTVAEIDAMQRILIVKMISNRLSSIRRYSTLSCTYL